jgi:hypothetical protein
VTVLGGRPGTDRTQETTALDVFMADTAFPAWVEPAYRGLLERVRSLTQERDEAREDVRKMDDLRMAEIGRLAERVRSLEAANERLERILYPPDSPPREDASGEASQSEVVVTAAASATGLPQCTCKWGASGAHNDGCPCAVLDVASPANGVNYTGPQPSVPCAYQPCTNRLLLKAGWGPQFCSEEHRSLGVASPAHPEAEPREIGSAIASGFSHESTPDSALERANQGRRMEAAELRALDAAALEMGVTDEDVLAALTATERNDRSDSAGTTEPQATPDSRVGLSNEGDETHE